MKLSNIKPLQEEFTNFLSRHPPKRVNQNLRNMLLEYLQLVNVPETDGMQDLLFDLQGLFQLLDAAEEHKNEIVESPNALSNPGK